MTRFQRVMFGYNSGAFALESFNVHGCSILRKETSYHCEAAAIVDFHRLEVAVDEYVYVLFSILQSPLPELPHAQLVGTVMAHLLFCIDGLIVVIDLQ